MKISVIVPVYNRLEHLRAVVLCLMKQTVKPYELIITDDGSKQKVEDFIGDLIPEIDFKIKHIYQEDKGFRKTRALNNGVKNSEGEILVFCDQDLIFPEDYLEKIKNNSKKGIFLMGRAEYTTFEEKEKILLELEKRNNYEEIIDNIIDKKYISNLEKLYKKDKRRRILKKLHLNKRGIKLVGMSYSLFKEDYIKVNGNDEKYQSWGCEDDDFGIRLEVAGIEGRELITDLIELHLYHSNDPTKKKSANEEYYYSRKKEILNKKDYFCKYGYNNSIDNDKIEIKILKN